MQLIIVYFVVTPRFLKQTINIFFCIHVNLIGQLSEGKTIFSIRPWIIIISLYAIFFLSPVACLICVVCVCSVCMRVLLQYLLQSKRYIYMCEACILRDSLKTLSRATKLRAYKNYGVVFKQRSLL
jgi:hypothetical protein